MFLVRWVLKLSRRKKVQIEGELKRSRPYQPSLRSFHKVSNGQYETALGHRMLRELMGSYRLREQDQNEERMLFSQSTKPRASSGGLVFRHCTLAIPRD